MITQAKAYAYLEKETALQHDIRMDIINALFEGYSEEPFMYKGDDEIGFESGRSLPLYAMLNAPPSIIRGFKTIAMSGDSIEDTDHLDANPVISRFDIGF